MVSLHIQMTTISPHILLTTVSLHIVLTTITLNIQEKQKVCFKLCYSGFKSTFAICSRASFIFSIQL